MKSALKKITFVALAAMLLAFSAAKADTVYSLSPFHYTASSTQANAVITPTVSSSSLQIPSLGSGASPCVIVSNASGTLATAACGGAASGTFTSVYAGTGIGVVTGTASATVSNLGVISFNGATGTVSYSGITGSAGSTLVPVGTGSQTVTGYSWFNLNSSTEQLSIGNTVNDVNLSLEGGISTYSGTVNLGSTALTQTGALVSLASTTISGNATTTALSITSLGSSGNPCLVVSATGAVSTSTCGAGGGISSLTAGHAITFTPSSPITSTGTISVNTSTLSNTDFYLSGAGSSTQVLVYTGTSTVAGSPNLTYSGGNFTVGGTFGFTPSGSNGNIFSNTGGLTFTVDGNASAGTPQAVTIPYDQNFGNSNSTLLLSVQGGETVGNVTSTALTVSGLASSGSPCLVAGTNGAISTSTCGTGGGGSVSTSSAITTNDFPFWSSVTGQLTGTSSLQNNSSGVMIAKDASTTFSGVTVSSTVPVLQLGPTTCASPNANGTYLCANAPTGFNGTFLSYQLAGTPYAGITKNGQFQALSSYGQGGGLNTDGNNQGITLAYNGGSSDGSGFNSQNELAYTVSTANYVGLAVNDDQIAWNVTGAGSSTFFAVDPMWKISSIASSSANLATVLIGGGFGSTTSTPLLGRIAGLDVNTAIGSSGLELYNSTSTGAGVIIEPVVKVATGSTGTLDALDVNLLEVQTSSVASTYALQVGTGGNVALSVKDNGIVGFNGSSTVITPSIGGAIVSGGCDSATTTVPSGLSSTTTAFPTQPENNPGQTIGGTWAYSVLTSPTLITTYVCSNVTVTPNSTAYVVKIIN